MHRDTHRRLTSRSARRMKHLLGRAADDLPLVLDPHEHQIATAKAIRDAGGSAALSRRCPAVPPFTSRHSPRSTDGNQVVAALPELANRSASPSTNLPFGERRSKCAARVHLHVLDWRRRPTFRPSHRYSARRDLLTASNLGIWESPELGGSIIAVSDPPHSRPSARSRQAIASRAA